MPSGVTTAQITQTARDDVDKYATKSNKQAQQSHQSKRDAWSNLFLTGDAAPTNLEDMDRYYNAEAAKKALGPRPVGDEVNMFLRLREARLMEQLWDKEKSLQSKVRDYVHHRTLERSSVNLQTGRVYRGREPVRDQLQREEAIARGLTLQAPASLPLMKDLLGEGRRAEVELVPKVQLLDELRDLRGWGPDKIRTYLAQNKIGTFTHSPLVEDYMSELRALGNLREDLAPAPHAHTASDPVLLDNERSRAMLKALKEAGASPQRMMEIMRELPLSHVAKAEFIKELDVGPLKRVELLRELPCSNVRELELLRELPLDPVKKLEYLRGLPLEPAKKVELMHELGLPLQPSPDLEMLCSVEGGPLQAMATLDELNMTPERKMALLGEMQIHDFVESEVARQFAALRDAPIPPEKKLEILHEMKLSQQERAELNRRLGYPVDPSEMRRDL